MILPVSVQFDNTDPVGLIGSVGFPEDFITSITPTVLAGNRPVLTVGAQALPHGNFYDPKAPGFNPECEYGGLIASIPAPNILVEGKPIAVVGPFLPSGSLCVCGHYVLGPGMPTVLVGCIP